MLHQLLNVNIKKQISDFTYIADQCHFDQKIPLLISQPLNQHLLSIKEVASQIISTRSGHQVDLNDEKQLSTKEIAQVFKDLVKDNVGNVVEIGDGLHPELTKKLTSRIANYLADSGFIKHIKLVQKFPNIRIKVGPYSTEQEHSNHPLSTSKLHCDIWAGAPTTLLICIMELTNIDNGPKIEFANIKKFPKKLAKKLPAYDHPSAKKFLASNVTHLISSELGHMHVLNTYTPHRTTYPGEGLRVSIDFRVALNTSVTQNDVNHLLTQGFCSPSDWL